jgi:hypothetical protein
MSDKPLYPTLYTYDPKNPPGPDVEYIPSLKDIERIGAFNRHVAGDKNAWVEYDAKWKNK